MTYEEAPRCAHCGNYTGSYLVSTRFGGQWLCQSCYGKAADYDCDQWEDRRMNEELEERHA